MEGQQAQSSPLTVTALTADIKRLLEQRFAAIELEGEVSRLTRHASGHFYFTIKDAHASISAVIWRSAAMRMGTLPKEGKSFVFSGHVSVYEPQGRYQFIVRKVEAAGHGKLAEEFEKRKQLFAGRGWFEQSRKKTVPELPRHIGIATSPSAAAFEDVKKVLATRPAWLQLTLAPCVVQGNSAPTSIATAIAKLNAMEQKPEVILLVRGGGSMEDLWCFNDEAVVRAIVESEIPVISGIGHEIDTTLADFAADLRAATPSNAAELASPDRDTLRRQLPRIPMLQQLIRQKLESSIHTVRAQRERLQHRIRLAQDKRHLDTERQGHALASAIRQLLRSGSRQLRQQQSLLARYEPHASFRRQQHLCDRLRQKLALGSQGLLSQREQQHERYKERLIRSSANRIEQKRTALRHLSGRLHALSPTQVLGRGYTMTFDAQGRLASSAAAISSGDAITVHFHDGHVDATANTVCQENQ